MNQATAKDVPTTQPNTGSYTASEASRLLRTPVRNIRRWMLGYTHGSKDDPQFSPPLWTSQLAMIEEHLEIGFRDLVELRFVSEFMKAGLGLRTIRHCLNGARSIVDDERPFSTRLFKTDGRTIFLQSIADSGDGDLLDLKNRQYVIPQVVEQSFKDLDIEDDTVTRWRPYNGKASIVLDPSRSFGQPIATDYGVPTVVLADAVKAEGSVARAARLYGVDARVVRDAVRFEASLLAA